MLLSYEELHQLIADGVIDADPSNVNGTSIDVCLGPNLLIEVEPNYGSHYNKFLIDLSDHDASVNWAEYTMDKTNGYRVSPGESLLGHTVEKFKLPADLTSEFRLRSSMARNLLNASLAVWIDPYFGFDSEKDTTLTLELQNISKHHHLILKPGLRIGQVVFFRNKPVPYDKGYAAKGRYNGQTTVQQSLGHGGINSTGES